MFQIKTTVKKIPARKMRILSTHHIIWIRGGKSLCVIRCKQQKMRQGK